MGGGEGRWWPSYRLGSPCFDHVVWSSRVTLVFSFFSTQNLSPVPSVTYLFPRYRELTLPGFTSGVRWPREPTPYPWFLNCTFFLSDLRTFYTETTMIRHEHNAIPCQYLSVTFSSYTYTSVSPLQSRVKLSSSVELKTLKSRTGPTDRLVRLYGHTTLLLT